MSVFQAILMLSALGLVVGVGTPIVLIQRRMARTLSVADVVIGVPAMIGGLFVPYACFYLSDGWLQTSLRQYLASLF